jgi:hypothetical protein
MALDFPASPTVGQKYPQPAVSGVPVYTWDGEKWTTLGGAIGSTGASDAIPLIDAGTGAAGSSTLWSRGDHVHPPITTSPTPPAGDNDTSIATTEFVSTAISTAVQNIYAAPFDAMAYSGLQINGAMEVTQERTLGTAITANGYICDGWVLAKAGTMALNASLGQSISLVPGLPNFLGLAIATAQASLSAADFVYVYQGIEGYRTIRLGWGTANAQPITLCFWSVHHRTGLYSGSIRNGAGNRSYAFTYTHNVADVAQYNTVSIPGDTTGTWSIDNTAGLAVSFTVAVGTTFAAPSANAWVAGNFLAAPGQINGVAATTDAFRITGVTVLPGSEAPSAARSPFVMRPYDQELVVCQRYFRWLPYHVAFQAYTAGEAMGFWFTFPAMRAAPTFSAHAADPGLTTAASNVATVIHNSATPYGGFSYTTAAAVGPVSASGYRFSADARL